MPAASARRDLGVALRCSGEIDFGGECGGVDDARSELIGERDQAVDLGGGFIGRTRDPAQGGIDGLDRHARVGDDPGGIVAAEHDMEAPEAHSIEPGRSARLDRLGERIVVERVRVGPKDRGTVGEHVDVHGRDPRVESYVGDSCEAAKPSATTNLRHRLRHHHRIRRRSHRRPNSTARLTRTSLRS